MQLRPLCLSEGMTFELHMKDTFFHCGNRIGTADILLVVSPFKSRVVIMIECSSVKRLGRTWDNVKCHDECGCCSGFVL